MIRLKMANGVEIPQIGFGTFRIPDDAVTQSVKYALNAGYRHIDTAAIYGNEKGVGLGIKESGVPRNEIFLTSKLWNEDQGYDSTLKAFDESLKKLGTDFLDLYLIHWPKDKNKESWKAMEKLYKDGRIKAIGVSNFKEHHLDDLLTEAEIVPMINQVELHPQFPQTELRNYCGKKGILVEAWGSLMQGQIFDKEIIKEIAEKHNKTVSQIGVRWAVQSGVVTIPKSTHEQRIKDNINVFDFELDNEDMKKIAELNTSVRIGRDPDNIDF
ncbi:aldo/keto reductase [Sebaldella sp. S0638]|uniref:aldo/keto reductase n=1 Tax=Sebaldella sp. S0638 TaxID=2957809 RepID=UPI0020A1EC0A|nr:aldo/keto reductase [Sebaldella sp. S0638]MCP1223716.1 aldo/keto reductase [Sebaldella sp. S0638]